MTKNPPGDNFVYRVRYVLYVWEVLRTRLGDDVGRRFGGAILLRRCFGEFGKNDGGWKTYIIL